LEPEGHCAVPICSAATNLADSQGIVGDYHHAFSILEKDLGKNSPFPCLRLAKNLKEPGSFPQRCYKRLSKLLIESPAIILARDRPSAAGLAILMRPKGFRPITQGRPEAGRSSSSKREL
jgi:hypothetical protein